MFFENYISSIDKAELVKSIQETSVTFLEKIKTHFRASEQLNALLLGNVQSGKTAQMLGIMSRMADSGYRIFLLLTTDNIDLHRQTYNRVRDSLSDFNVYNERDDILLTPASLYKPTVIVLKKNSRVLSRWKNIFLNSNILRGIVLTIFDDEADASSLNTLVNKHRVSTINKKLSDIKNTAANTIYIEVTATPQAVLLQTQVSGWKPNFIYYFKPGSDYLGGNYFYPKSKSLTTIFTNNYEIDEIKNGGDVVCPIGLRRSILSFLINCAHRRINGQMNCNFMIHPSARISIHNQFVEVVQDHLTLLQKSTEDNAFETSLLEEWSNLQQTKPDLESFEDIKETVIELLDNTEIIVIPLNSKSFVSRDPNDPDSLDLSKGYNIVIGGNTLGRGITFPNLQTVYYCRSSKVMQADTYWQHSRIFGYDREKQMVRIFIPQPLYMLFSELNASNEILIKQIENDFDNIQIIYPKGINPTRKNVVDQDSLDLIQGGINMFPSMPIASNVDIINKKIEGFASEKYVNIDSDLVVELLRLVKVEEEQDFNIKKFVSCVQALKNQRPSIKCKLIVRLDRDISKNTGTLLSPNDRLLGDSFNKDIVLTMYRVIGTNDKGWNGQPLWIPNIKFPENCYFYDVD